MKKEKFLINAVPNAKNSYNIEQQKVKETNSYGMRHSHRYMVHNILALDAIGRQYLYFAKEEDLILRVWIEFSWRI